jgi:hypothetical protein
VDDVFRRYVELTELLSGTPSLGSYEAADRCRYCLVGEKAEVNGSAHCALCNQKWRAKIQAFTRREITRDMESAYLSKLDDWSHVKALVEPIPRWCDTWFWGFCLTAMFAYVDPGIGTVSNVVRWGQVYRPQLKWEHESVQDAILCARSAARERSSSN